MNKLRSINNTRDYFPRENGELLIGAIPLRQLAIRVGQTPFYAYDRQKMIERVAELRRHLPDAIRLYYAIKANPMPAVVEHMAGLVDGFDVASGGELKLALDTSITADHISFAGPGKRDDEIASAIDAGVTLNLESQTELERTTTLGEKLGVTPRVAVRINPNFELKSSGMKMGGGPKPFGIDVEQVVPVVERIKTLNVDFRGFHIFTGSQNLRAEAIIEAQEKTFEMAYQLADETQMPVPTLNIGGGFGIPYFPGDVALDMDPIQQRLHTLMEEKQQRLPDTEVIIELGRYLVGEAGVYVCKILDRKVSRGHVFLITDGGLHHHLAASGNFGQVIRKNFPVAVGNKLDNTDLEKVTVTGCLCTPLDVLADNVELPRADVDDLIVIFQSGAYGYSASPHGFLSQTLAAECLV